ncbi:MAG: hypothetical protein LBJ18_04335 [Rickettsiales bacterium]|jgi:hypothetical protein|nr:hypothetical protein [Rickettsiales bacterium]
MKKLFVLLFFCPFVLLSCGFSPMYSVGTARDIYVAPITGTNGIDLRNALNAKFGVAGNTNARYTLTVVLSEPLTTYKAIQKTGDATWQEVQLTASYVLKEGDREIAKGKDTAAESYTFVRYLVAANASQNAAVANSIKTLSDKIGTRVIAETNK